MSDQWNELHSWQLKYKKEHNLSSSQFLRNINLEPNSSFVQYLSKESKNRKPSCKEGTVGLQLRKALEKAKTSTTPLSNVSRTSKEIFGDFLLDKESKLLIKGILSIDFDDITEDVINIKVFTSWPADENFIRDTLELHGIKIGKITIVCLKNLKDL